MISQLDTNLRLQRQFLQEHMEQRVEHHVVSSLQLELTFSKYDCFGLESSGRIFDEVCFLICSPKIYILKSFDETVSTAFVLSFVKAEINMKQKVVNLTNTMDLKIKLIGIH